MIAGVALMLAGQLLHPYFPINKNLWTSTYVLFTGGFAYAAPYAVLLGRGFAWLAEVGGAISCVRHERDPGLCPRGDRREIGIDFGFASPVAACEPCMAGSTTSISFHMRVR